MASASGSPGRARADGHHWRARACAILTGIGTVKADDPQLNVRAVETPRQPRRIVVDSKLEIDLSAKILQGGGTWIAAAVGNPGRKRRWPQPGTKSSCCRTPAARSTCRS
jgi:riboflavin biosynthesis pyrimidine reductase